MSDIFQKKEILSVEEAREKMVRESDLLVIARGKNYGPVDASMKTIACLWSIRTGTNVQPSDVCDMMEDLKYVRSKESPNHYDNGPDALNYKAFAYALREKGM